MTNVTDKLEDIRISITLPASRDRVFEIFTRHTTDWWPRRRYFGDAPRRVVEIEPRVGGRIVERDEKCGEYVWGHLLVWSPPERLTFSWQIDHDGRFQSDIHKVSDVDVHFVAVSQDKTCVELTHRNFDRHGASAYAVRQSVTIPDGWKRRLIFLASDIDRYH